MRTGSLFQALTMHHKSSDYQKCYWKLRRSQDFPITSWGLSQWQTKFPLATTPSGLVTLQFFNTVSLLRKSSAVRLSIHPDFQAEEETGEHSFPGQVLHSLCCGILGSGTSMPLYPFCMKLILLLFETPNKVCAEHKTRCVLLKSTTDTKLQTAFSRMTAALGKGKRTMMR